MKYIHLFAVREDLLPVLALAESKGPLKYVLTGNFLRDEMKGGPTVFDTFTEIPNLGKARSDSSVGCDCYLVCARETPVKLDQFSADDGRERVCIDQLLNPDTVAFCAGGLWNEDFVLQGDIGTASHSQASQALMKRFHAAIKNSFSKVKAFYVGPKALTLLQAGKRFTSSAQSPREFDLVS